MPPSSIHYFCADIIFKIPNPRKTNQWIKKVIKQEKKRLNNIDYIFCSDEYLYTLNSSFLGHKTFTDIITFDLSDQPGNGITGEIYISIERVKVNSIKLKVSFIDELHRVMIHGVLHLIGYGDKKPQQKREMRETEDSYLSLR